LPSLILFDIVTIHYFFSKEETLSVLIFHLK